MLRAAAPAAIIIISVAAQRRRTRARADLSSRRVGAAVSFEERAARVPLMERRVAKSGFRGFLLLVLALLSRWEIEKY